MPSQGLMSIIFLNLVPAPLGFPQAPVRGENSCIWAYKQQILLGGWEALATCLIDRSVQSQSSGWFSSKHWFLWHSHRCTHRHESVQIHINVFFPSAEVVEGSEPSTHRGHIHLRWELNVGLRKEVAACPTHKVRQDRLGIAFLWLLTYCCSVSGCVTSADVTVT